MSVRGRHRREGQAGSTAWLVARTSGAVLLVMAALGGAPALALASASNAAAVQYDGTPPDGQLPFTGYAIGGVVLLALVFLSSGLLLRRTARRAR